VPHWSGKLGNCSAKVGSCAEELASWTPELRKCAEELRNSLEKGEFIGLGRRAAATSAAISNLP